MGHLVFNHTDRVTESSTLTRGGGGGAKGFGPAIFRFCTETGEPGKCKWSWKSHGT